MQELCDCCRKQITLQNNLCMVLCTNLSNVIALPLIYSESRRNWMQNKSHCQAPISLLFVEKCERFRLAMCTCHVHFVFTSHKRVFNSILLKLCTLSGILYSEFKRNFHVSKSYCFIYSRDVKTFSNKKTSPFKIYTSVQISPLRNTCKIISNEFRESKQQTVFCLKTELFFAPQTSSRATQCHWIQSKLFLTQFP